MPKPVPTKAFLQPAKAAAMCTAPCAGSRPPPPIPPFLLVQNLHDEYTGHQWLKGFKCQILGQNVQVPIEASETNGTDGFHLSCKMS